MWYFPVELVLGARTFFSGKPHSDYRQKKGSHQAFEALSLSRAASTFSRLLLHCRLD